MVRIILIATLMVATVVGAEENYDAAREALKTLVPGLEVDRVRPAPFEGFVEMLLGAQLIYVSPICRTPTCRKPPSSVSPAPQRTQASTSFFLNFHSLPMRCPGKPLPSIQR